MSQREELYERLDEISEPIVNEKVLVELAYTANETGIFDDGLSTSQIMNAWKLVTLAVSLGDHVPEELIM